MKIKKLLALCLIGILGLLSLGQTGIQPISFPFIGKWNPSDPPMLIADYGLQDIQNLRKDGKHFKGIKGHSKINTTALSTYPYILNGYHFKKDQPAESHVIVYAADAYTPTAAVLYRNTTAIPSAGDFSATVLYTPDTLTYPFSFSDAPGGNMVASNGDQTLIWGGNEIPETAFLTSSADVTYSLTYPRDYSEVLNNTLTDAGQTGYLSTGIDSYVVLLLQGNEADGTGGVDGIQDSSASDHTITAVGGAVTDDAQGKFNNSIYFDGTNDYLTAPDHANWYFGADPFTIDVWVRFSDFSVSNGICGQYVDNDNYWYLTLPNGYVRFVVKSGGEYLASYDSDRIINVTNEWHHVEIVRNGTSFYIFVDGVSRTLTTYTAISTNAVPDLAAVLEIGGAFNHTYIMHGWIDELRISKGIARHTADFTPPTRENSTIASNYFLVGARRPLQGVKFYVLNGNTETSDLDAFEWTGSGWSELTITDNTASGGVSLAQTGTVTWDSTETTSKKRYFNGYSLYWYKFYLDAGDAELYYVTTDAPIQTIKNIWDGVEVQAWKAKKYDQATYVDSISAYQQKWAAFCKRHPGHKICKGLADAVNLLGDNDDNTYADWSSLTSGTHTLLFGFAEPQQGFSLRFVPTKINTTAATTLTVEYWNGGGWASVPAMYDGTSANSISFARNGTIIFSPIPEGQELPWQAGEEFPMYHYRLSFDKNLSANVHVSELRGIPATEEIKGYRFSTSFVNRLFLFNQPDKQRNVAIYSSYNAPDIINGEDSGMLSFGDNTDLTAATVIYNLFGNVGGQEQLIVAKANEVYRVTGSSPDDWEVQKISPNIGCVAPQTMASVDLAEVGANLRRQVAVFVSDKGVYITDGATVQSISEDIKCYFDPTDVRYIPASMQSKSVGWYDPNLKVYKLLIASGSSATTLNKELEFSFVYNEWTNIYREAGAVANPLQSGWQVTDTNGMTYTYGGNTGGYVYRLENTNRFDGTRITSYLQTKDLILDTQLPAFRDTTVKYIRTLFKKKQTGEITIAHYGDGTRTVDGTDGQEGPTDITAAEALLYGYHTQSTLLGPFLYHSFKYQATTNIADGLELTGIAIYAEPYTLMR